MALPLRTRLEHDLRAAIRLRDQARISVLRITLAAIANAEAVDPAAEQVPAGLRGDVARRELSEADIRAVIARERHDYHRAGEDLRRAGQPAAAAEHDQRAGILAPYLLESRLPGCRGGGVRAGGRACKAGA